MSGAVEQLTTAQRLGEVAEILAGGMLRRRARELGSQVSDGEQVSLAGPWLRSIRRCAHSMELRAATRLAHARVEHGERERACNLLEPICAWFTEGFETPDLPLHGWLRHLTSG